MSILVLQLIIKQWDKSQRTKQHVDERAEMVSHYPIIFPQAHFTADKQCIIDLHSDDLLKNKRHTSQPNNNIIQIDRFQVNLNKKELNYRNSLSDPAPTATVVGLLDERWIQCKYDWRYSVYEGGLYYWLYEEVTLNAIVTNSFDENIFLNSEPERIMLNA